MSTFQVVRDLSLCRASNVVLRYIQELGLCSALVESAAMMGIHKPTDIQRRCIPAILNGTPPLVKVDDCTAP